MSVNMKIENEGDIPDLTDLIERAEYAAVLSEAIADTFETAEEITLGVSDARLCAEALRVLHVYLNHAAPLHSFMAHLSDAAPLQFTLVPNDDA